MLHILNSSGTRDEDGDWVHCRFPRVDRSHYQPELRPNSNNSQVIKTAPSQLHLASTD